MFEGLVRQLLVGYLGRYVKDIQKEKLKITFWNEEVLLENVELILEAFDYLQLPFALKQGRVGRLSIKIPWKKLGWDPIIIILEDIYISASQRDDEEWSSDAVERREFAGKKAKIAAAELAKLSRRVCDNHAGQSFISYITAKILDNIQISIRNFHVMFLDMIGDLGYIKLGLKFSSLRIMKQILLGSLGGWVRGSQVNKTVEIVGLEIYCSCQSEVHVEGCEVAVGTKVNPFEEKVDFILAPCDAVLSLLVNRSGKLDNSTPQYSVNADLNSLVFTLNDVQLQQILNLWDYLCICRLRDKYGRFRPWCSPLSRKVKGWQISWWHYAQESVLSDVRKNLKKTSWRYLGHRLIYRRRYVNLYRKKLEFLHNDQSIDDNILKELEVMEKESDIEDILSYRSAAECELQHLFGSLRPEMVATATQSAVEKSQVDDRSMRKPRGWLNWLSLGMLGAGGTEDSCQFSGVISDDIVKDIYEATKFHPQVPSNVSAADEERICFCAIKIDIHQISATLLSIKYNQEVAKMIFIKTMVECKIWMEAATINILVNSIEMVNPLNQRVLIFLRMPLCEKDVEETGGPSCSFQVDVSPKQEVNLSVKVMLSPLEVTYDAKFLLCLLEFFDGFKSFQSLHRRVLSTLNGIENAEARLLSKARCIMSRYKRVMWDITVNGITVYVPWNTPSEQNNLVLQLGALCVTSKYDWSLLSSSFKEQSVMLKGLSDSILASDIAFTVQPQNLYDHFDIQLRDLEMGIQMPSQSQSIPIFEKFSAAVALRSCLIPNESLLKQLEVLFQISSLHVNFSPSIYGVALELAAHLRNLTANPGSEQSEDREPLNVTSIEHDNHPFAFSLGVILQSVRFKIDLENDGKDASSLMLALDDMEIWYDIFVVEELLICMKALNIAIHPTCGDGDGHILYSCGNKSHATSSHLHGIDGRHNNKIDGLNDMNVNAVKCCILHFNTGENSAAKISIYLNDAEIHCYPYIFGLLAGFYERLSACANSSCKDVIGPEVNDAYVKPMSLSPCQRFGFSNFVEDESVGHDSIPLDCFPFVTLQNFGNLGSFDSSHVDLCSEWRKRYKLRDKKVRTPEFCLEKEPTIFHTQPSKPKFGMDASVTPGSSCHPSLHDVYLALSGIKLHFHDSSCIIGSLTLPTCKSSLSISEDYFDVLCSVEGLTVTSSWTKNFLELVWGPSLPYLSPILNFRVIKGKNLSSSAKLEINIAIQHVFCFLPPEYLAMIIGYFTLPDWSFQSNDQFSTGRNAHAGLEEETSLIYKFEIVDSALITPAENYELQFLQFEIKQLYFTLFFGGSLDDALKDIPPECSIPVHKLAEMNHCLNLFGRELSLSLMLFKDRNSSSFLCQGTECQNVSLVESLNADIWVRIPCESESTNKSSQAVCMVTRIRNCEVIFDDNHALGGFMALLENINQFASVEDQSRCFKSDVLQFLQLTRCLKEGTEVLFPVSNTTVTELECCVDSLFLILKQHRNELLEMNYRVELQFTCSGSLRNGVVKGMDVCFSSMVLYSVPKTIIMAKSSLEQLSPVPDTSISRSSQGPVELCVLLPSIDIWLYFSEWMEIVDLLNSYVGNMTQFVSTGATFKDVVLNNTASGDSSITVLPNCIYSTSMLTESVSEDTEQDDPVLIVILKDTVITFHFPVYVTEASKEVQIAEVDEKECLNVSSDVVEENYCRFVMVSLHSKRTEVLINSKNASLKSGMEKVCGMLSKCEEKGVQSCPLFEIFGVNLEVDISSNQMKLSLIQLKIQCECFNVWFSYHVFYFLKHIEFNISEEDSSLCISCPIEFEVQLKKVSFLLSDGRWSSCRPLLEILMRNILLHVSMTESTTEDFITGELSMNYNNIQKVFWEPFIEPWNFTINVTRKQESSSLLNSSVLTDVHLMSSSLLNLNLTEPFTECLSRTIDMIKDAWDLSGKDDTSQRQLSLNSSQVENIIAGKHAPYVLQNLTSLPLEYHVYEGPLDSVEFGVSEFKERRYVQPGCSVPIYISESAEKQFFRHRSFHSLEKLDEWHTYGFGHHFISIQLDGTSVPSVPISMDLVGQTYFEVDFSKASNEELNMSANMSKDVDNKYKKHMSRGFIVPVVFDVSVQRYGKLIQLYSTVILFNQTSMPLEFRFDIPFGVSPKILDPLNPGKAMPLPLHLAEAGCVRWRPSGNSYLWSETCNLSNLLAQESKIGLFRSFVSYPSHPSSDPFRCCMSTRNIILPSYQKPRQQSAVGSEQKIHSPAESQERCIHHLTLSTPLAVRSFLPEEAKLIVDTGGMTHSAILSEVKNLFHHIDPSHDLELEIQIHGYRPSYVKFPRAETFCSIAKFDGIKFSLSETITLIPGPIHITLDKSVDAFSGSRELNIFVPFLLYNCTGIPLWISELAYEQKGANISVPSYYDIVEREHSAGKRDGLSSIIGCSDYHVMAPGWQNSLMKKSVSSLENSNPQLDSLNGKASISPYHLHKSNVQSNKNDFNFEKSFQNTSKVSSGSSDHMRVRESNSLGSKQAKVRAHMFSPCKPSSSDEVMVRVSRSLPECEIENISSVSWSSPFYLVPRSGSATVLIPQSSSNAASVVSVTSSAISGSFSEMTSIIMFQPRYVISNACSKDLFYKQKGTDCIIPLAVGEHFHLQWTDTTRELLVSVRYNEPGSQWSGSFIPDQLGDTQVKMRNYITGSSNILRIEVQNVDVPIDNKIVGNGRGNSGTNLILLSDDDTGYIPYRIDNFSKERLRIYQQRCENFETIVYPYTSYPYSWDEPCYPRRLTVEVPGERILGSYALDDVQDFVPVSLPLTTGKNERTLHLSVHAEGATKVLSIVDSTYHIPNVVNFGEKKKHVQKQEKFTDYKEKFSVFISYIGISLINSRSEEMVYACAKNITIDLLQSLDQQKLSVKLLSLQIDNQFRNSPYPVILSFDQEYRSNPMGSMNKDIGAVTRSERVLQADGSLEPVFYFYASKWRKMDSLLVSFEHICLRISDFRLEIEQQVMLNLFEFVKNVSSNLRGEVSQFSDAILHPPANDPAHEYFSARTEPLHFSKVPFLDGLDKGSKLLPSVVPIGAPWQQVYLSARQQKKVYVELFDLAPIKLTVSFSTIPWVLKNSILTSGELLVHRGLLALGDIEGAQIHLKRLSIAHHMASWESIQEILIRHYSRQLFHEIYKVFGSAGVIGNPMGFARRVGIGIRDFLSVPARGILQSPTGLITGMVQGTTSLLSNTVYAFSDATTQFSKAARKGIVAFTFDDQAFSRVGQQQTGVSSHSGGVISEVLEGLTGLLQSPIRGAERHGLPGVFSGIALGITGLVAKPAASVLELTGKTAQSIRNRSRLHQMRPQHHRVRLPRPLSSILPLRPFSWEEAIGTSILLEAGGDDMKLDDEVLVTSKALKIAGKFFVLTQSLILIVSCASLVDLGKAEFRGIAADSKWVIESAIGLDTIIHAATDGAVVHIVGSNSNLLTRQDKSHPKSVVGSSRTVRWSGPAPLPIFETNLEMEGKEDAENLLKILSSTIKLAKERGWHRGHVLHRYDIK